MCSSHEEMNRVDHEMTILIISFVWIDFILSHTNNIKQMKNEMKCVHLSMVVQLTFLTVREQIPLKETDNRPLC